MRKYSFDELPQLFNVLRGEMSLVGPRPWALYDAIRINPSWAATFGMHCRALQEPGK